MMVLSGILKSSNQNTTGRPPPVSETTTKTPSSPTRSNRRALQSTSTDTSAASDAREDPFIRDQENLLPIDADVPDLRELNNSLAVLAVIFPDVQVEVFREMLSTFDEESRLAVATEHLLKNKMRFVRGRYRVASKENERGKAAGSADGVGRQDGQEILPIEDKFRSDGYKKAVKTITYHEFKGLSRSTINAVLAEHNHSYTLARPTLVGLSSKSWRFSISSLFLRRKPISSAEAKNHPLVIWQSTGHGAIAPTLKTTGSPELDKELFESLIVPLQERLLAEREEKDHALALELNNNEAEEQDAMHDCECCYTAYAFEELSACDDGGHFICFQCVRHAVNEAIFGQGWQRNINLDAGTLRCLAAMQDECRGCVPQDLVQRAFAEEKGGEDILRKLDERLMEDSLLKTGLPLIRCPFCNYAEIDELYLPESRRLWRLKRLGPSSVYTGLIFVLGVGLIPFLFPIFLLVSILFLCFSAKRSFAEYTTEHLKASIIRLRRKQHGLKFICQNRRCSRSSCISCSKAWSDIHICHESSLLALRTQVELAMSLAIKRTCPRCNTSFVKSSGCNKLTCICGYQMCYVCRKDIGSGEGYRHFCEHFRPNGGRRCTECSKCDLYRCEDDEVVVKKAKEEAERRWMEKEGGGIGGDEKVRKALEEKWLRGKEMTWWEGGSNWWKWRMPDGEQLLDSLIESIIE